MSSHFGKRNLKRNLKRQCGKCRICCVAMSVGMIGKEHYEPCQHLCERGCGIHDEPRCEICETYQCAYLAGEVSERYNPNFCGFNTTISRHALIDGQSTALPITPVVCYALTNDYDASAVNELIARHNVVVFETPTIQVVNVGHIASATHIKSCPAEPVMLGNTSSGFEQNGDSFTSICGNGDLGVGQWEYKNVSKSNVNAFWLVVMEAMGSKLLRRSAIA